MTLPCEDPKCPGVPATCAVWVVKDCGCNEVAFLCGPCVPGNLDYLRRTRRRSSFCTGCHKLLDEAPKYGWRELDLTRIGGQP